MTDQPEAQAAANDTAPAIPPLERQILGALAQKGLTTLAAALTSYGVIAPDQSAQFVSLGVSVLLWSASFLWTYVHERAERARKVALLNAPPPARQSQ